MSQFRVTNFKPDTRDKINKVNAVLAEYDGQRLTARQVYYQFVARDWLPNTPRSYQNLTSLLTDARYAGLVPWSAIEDRGREPDVPGEWDSIDEIIDVAIRSFRLPRWRDQPAYVELWVEKQALAGVLAPIASRNHVPLMVNKGYSSASAMKAAAERMHEACGTEAQVICPECDDTPFSTTSDGKCTSCERRIKAPNIQAEPLDTEKEVVVLYLGDHDPSGEDMVRDIRCRLTEFGVPNLRVEKLALTMDQIKRFKPPPNPAKMSDSRAKDYIRKFGRSSWELDALPPRELNALVENAIRSIVDADAMAAVIAQETVDRERVREAIKRSRTEVDRG